MDIQFMLTTNDLPAVLVALRRAAECDRKAGSMESAAMFERVRDVVKAQRDSAMARRPGSVFDVLHTR